MLLNNKERITACLVVLSLTGCQEGSNDFSTESINEAGEASKVQAIDGVGGVNLNVRLGAVARFQQKTIEAKRNLFRFGQPLKPASQLSDFLPQKETSFIARSSEGKTTAESFRSLRYIGLVDASASIGKIAVVSDGKVVFHGRRGDVLDGRFRILGIGLDRLEVENLVDGVKQTLFFNRASQQQ